MKFFLRILWFLFLEPFYPDDPRTEYPPYPKRIRRSDEE